MAIKVYYNKAGKESLAIRFEEDASNYLEVVALLISNNQNARYYEPKKYINIEVEPPFKSYYTVRPGDWLVKNYTDKYVIVKDFVFKTGFKEKKDE